MQIRRTQTKIKRMTLRNSCQRNLVDLAETKYNQSQFIMLNVKCRHVTRRAYFKTCYNWTKTVQTLKQIREWRWENVAHIKSSNLDNIKAWFVSHTYQRNPQARYLELIATDVSGTNCLQNFHTAECSKCLADQCMFSSYFTTRLLTSTVHAQSVLESESEQWTHERSWQERRNIFASEDVWLSGCMNRSGYCNGLRQVTRCKLIC